MYYYVDNGKKGTTIKVHLSNRKDYIEGNIPLWSKGVHTYKTGSIAGKLTNKLTYVVVEKYNYGQFDLVKVFNTRSEASRWVYNKKRAIYPHEYSYNIVLATRNCFEEDTSKKVIDRIEDHDFTYRYDGGDYVVLDHGSIVARLDNPKEAREWIKETEEELMGNAE